MPTISNMLEVLDSLLRKTRDGTIRWQPDEASNRTERLAIELLRRQQAKPVSISSSAYVAYFPHSVIRVRCNDVSTGESLIWLIVEDLDGNVLGEWMAVPDAEGWESATALVEHIRAALASDFGQVLGDLEQSDQTEESAVGDEKDRSADEFFRFAKGKWHLTFYHGDKSFSENVMIDEKGMYYTDRRGSTPYFRLTDVYYDPEGPMVSFSKVEAQGPRQGKVRQIEVLRLDPGGKWMRGYAQHDGHRLQYVRT